MVLTKAQLRNKQVVFRINGTTGPIAATVVHVEEDCLWFSGGDVIAKIAEGYTALPAGKGDHVVCVPFGQILWLIAAPA